MYAIIKTGGKQYKAQVGEALYVEKLDAEQGATVTFDQVILVAGEGDARSAHQRSTAQLLLVKLRSKAVKRRSLPSNTSLRSIPIKRRVIVNLIPKLSLTRSTLN